MPYCRSHGKMLVVFFFFFKQKTAYEIYQCDWSSDVCSSDLAPADLLPSPSERERMHAARIVAEHADLVSVSTPALGDRLKQINPRVRVIPNVLDEGIWFGPEVPHALTQPPDRPLGLLYMGTKTHLNDLRMVEGPIRQVLAEYPGRVRFDVIGCVPEEVREPWFNAVPIPRQAREYPAFAQWLRQTARWEIGIAPLEDTRFNNYKSPLKFLDYSALGLASVCSDLTPYRTIVEGGTNGILVSPDAKSWYQALKLLVEDHELRLQLATRAYETVRHEHVLRAKGSLWLEAYRGLKTGDPRMPLPTMLLT